MPFLKKAQILPVKGIDLSVPNSYLPEGNNYTTNLKLVRGEMVKREGKETFGDVSIGAHAILHLDSFETSTLDNYLIRITKRNIQKYNTGAGLWRDVTGALFDLSGSDTDFFSSVVAPVDDLFIFTQFVDLPRKLDNTGSDSALLGGVDFKAKFVEYLAPYVVFAYLEEGGTLIPTKMRWSDANNPELYTGGTSGSSLLVDEPSAIRGMKKLASNLFIYKEKSIYRYRKVSTEETFSNGGGPFEVGKGLFSGRAIADTGEFHAYMGNNDFHINDSVRVTDIGGPIREYIFGRINRSRSETMFALHVEIYKEVWFFITVTGVDYPTEIWKYRYDLGLWYQDTVRECPTATLYKVISSLTWDDIIPTWDSQSWAWDDRSGQANAPVPIFGFTDGFTEAGDTSKKNDVNLAYTGRLETKDFCSLDRNGELMEDTRWLQMDVFARGNKLDAYYSKDEGSTWVFIGTKTLDEQTRKYTYWFDVVSTRIRFRLENGDSDSTFTLRSFQPYFIARESNIYG